MHEGMKVACHNSKHLFGPENKGSGSMVNRTLTDVNRDVHGLQAGLRTVT